MTEKRDEEGDRPGFFSRWSRMKREAAQDSEDEALPAVADPELSEPLEPARQDNLDPDVISQEEIDALPPVESVTDRAGLEPFFRKGVPKVLRNAARRRMWMLNPKIRDYLDVARDYAYDWNTPGGVPGSGGRIAPETAAKLAERLLVRSDWRSKPRQENPVAAAEDAASDLKADEIAVGTVADRDPAEVPEPADSPDESVEPFEERAEARPASNTFVEYGPDFGVAESPVDDPPAPPRRHGSAIPR